MEPPIAAPEPGWYPDAVDPALERWWDGAGWSPATRRAPGATGAPDVLMPGPDVLMPGPDVPMPGPDVPVADHAGPDPAGAGSATTSSGGDPQTPPVPAHPSAEPSRRNPYAAPPEGDRSGAGPGPQPSGAPPSRQSGAGSGPVWQPGTGARPATGPTTPDGDPLAPSLLRLVARIVDAVIVGVLSAAAGAPYLVPLTRQLSPQIRSLFEGTPSDLTSALTDPAVAPLILRYQFVGLLVGGVYTVVLTRLYGGTLGKLMLGLRVRSWEEPGHPGWTQALARWLTRELVSQITFAGLGSVYLLLDSVWLLWDPRRQCLHDKVPGTVVIRRR